jgi:hypothetical protein
LSCRPAEAALSRHLGQVGGLIEPRRPRDHRETAIELESPSSVTSVSPWLMSSSDFDFTNRP